MKRCYTVAPAPVPCVPQQGLEAFQLAVSFNVMWMFVGSSSTALLPFQGTCAIFASRASCHPLVAVCRRLQEPGRAAIVHLAISTCLEEPRQAKLATKEAARRACCLQHLFWLGEGTPPIPDTASGHAASSRKAVASEASACCKIAGHSEQLAVGS